jgi:hypothetical protein
MIFNIIEPTTRTAGLGVIRLTEMKRILFHEFYCFTLSPLGRGIG